MRSSSGEGRRMSGGPGFDGRSRNGGDDGFGGLHRWEARAAGTGWSLRCNTGLDDADRSGSIGGDG